MIPGSNEYLDKKWENIASSSEVRVTDESFGADLDREQTNNQTDSVEGSPKRKLAAATAAVGLGYMVIKK